MFALIYFYMGTCFDIIGATTKKSNFYVQNIWKSEAMTSSTHLHIHIDRSNFKICFVENSQISKCHICLMTICFIPFKSNCHWLVNFLLFLLNCSFFYSGSHITQILQQTRIEKLSWTCNDSPKPEFFLFSLLYWHCVNSANMSPWRFSMEWSLSCDVWSFHMEGGGTCHAFPVVMPLVMVIGAGAWCVRSNGMVRGCNPKNLPLDSNFFTRHSRASAVSPLIDHRPRLE